MGNCCAGPEENVEEDAKYVECSHNNDSNNDEPGQETRPRKGDPETVVPIPLNVTDVPIIP